MNPYTSPVSLMNPVPDQKPALRELVFAWERFRLYYNALLALPGVLILYTLIVMGAMSPGEALISGGLVAVAANACFFLGPAAELYLRGLFRNGEPLGRGRLLIFGGGTLLSLMLFVLFFVQLKTGWP